MKKLIALSVFFSIAICSFGQVVNVGTGANTGDGDKLRDAMIKINAEFEKNEDSITSYDSRLTVLEEDSTGAFNYIEFNTTYEDGAAEGRLQWNIDDGTIEIGMPGDSVNLQIGQEMLIRATNDEGSTISNGQLVYISGGAGANPYVKLADNRYITKVPVIGMATEDIEDGQKGYITTEGLVRNVDTDGMSIGNMLWLDTAGLFTNTMPTSPALANQVGVVIRANQNNGVVYVKPKFYPLVSMLSDVYVSSIANNNELVWDATDSRWENRARNTFSDYVKTDTVKENTSAHGVLVDNVLIKDDGIYVDDIYERTTNNGVSIDGLLVKDHDIYFDYSGDPNTHIQHNVGDAISFTAGGNQVFLMQPTGVTSRTLVPLAASTYNLGTTYEYWKYAYLDTIYVDNTTTRIVKDGSNNLSFTDAVTGTKTLAQLADTTEYVAGEDIRISNDSIIFDYDGGYAVFSENMWFEADTSERMFYVVVPGESINPSSAFTIEDDGIDIVTYQPVIASNSGVARVKTTHGLIQPATTGVVAQMGVYSSLYNVQLRIDSTEIMIEDDVNERGVVYATNDYDDNFVDSSLITKKYVDTALYRTKRPHTWLYFADSSITITADQNTYYQITNASDSLWRVRDLYGEITISADTVIVTSHDHYNVWASVSFTGTVNDDYQIRLVQAEAGGAVGEIAKTYVSTDGTNPVTVSLYGYWKPVDGDRLWIQIRNTASGDDPTIIGGEMTVQWYHYE